MIRFLEHAGVAGLLLCGGVASAVAQTPCDTCVFDVHRLGEATATGHRQHHTQNVAAKTLSATDIRRNGAPTTPPSSMPTRQRASVW